MSSSPNPMTLSALTLAKQIASGKVSSVQLVEQALATIDAVEPKVNAYNEVLRDFALEKAAAVDAKLKKGEPVSPLAGVPISIKDNMNLRGFKTTCSSKILENFVSPYTATAVSRVLDHDLVPVGKVNMDEFAMGSSTENSAFKKTSNPWKLSAAPGGSSGGSAASVAAATVPLSLGSDTGGSIRQPASFCGLVGVKPTYGRVSRYGLVAFASSLDQIGPFARNVDDAAALLGVISGYDPHDSTSLNIPVPNYSALLGRDIKGLRIGIPNQLVNDITESGVAEAFYAALDHLKNAGAIVDTVDMNSFDHGLATYYILAPAEASANLSRFDGVRYGYRDKTADNLRDMFKKSRGHGFGSEVKRRIIIGTYVLSSGYYDAYYLKAQKMRTIVRDDFNRAFSRFDVLLSPTAPTTAFDLGSMEDPLTMYKSDVATIPVNLAGLPGMSIPCGYSNGMPVGLQVIAPSFKEDVMFQVGHAYQQLTSFHHDIPSLVKELA